jgi:hypothetical protein
MTTPSTLLPGHDLDILIDDALGIERWGLVMRSDDGKVAGLCGQHGGTDREEAMRQAATCKSCWRVERVPSRDWSSDLEANADVERWLVEHVPTEESVITRNRIPSWRYVVPYYAVRYAPNGDTEWAAEYGWEDEEGDRHMLCEASAFANETQGDPIAARLLAVCRFAVRVAGELKKMEGKR